MGEDHQRLVSRQPRQPVNLGGGYRPSSVIDSDLTAAHRQWRPGKGHGVDHGDRGSVGQRFEEGARRRRARRARFDLSIEPAAAESQDRRRIPESQRQTPQVAGFAGMPAARREIVIAVQDGDAIRGQESARAERVERGVEECRLPAIEQIAGDDEVVDRARGDAIESSAELDRIAFISQMQV